jgi:hypothetical protein
LHALSKTRLGPEVGDYTEIKKSFTEPREFGFYLCNVMLNFDLAQPTPRAFGKPRAGARIIAVTGQLDSWLAKRADMVLDAGVAQEGGALGFIPRISAAAEWATVSAAEVLVLGALSAALQNERGLTPRAGLRERP